MSNFRRKLLSASSNESSNESESYLLDARFDVQNMYDSASGFPITLDSAGRFNTTYNCLEKKYGSGSSCTGAAKMQLSNHPLRNLNLSQFTSTSEFIFDTYFLPITNNSSDFWNGVGFSSDCNSTSNNWNYAGKWTVLKNYVQYGTDLVYVKRFHMIGETFRKDEIYLNDVLLKSESSSGNNVSNLTKLNRITSGTNFIFLPCPYSQQKNRSFYIKRMTIQLIL